VCCSVLQCVAVCCSVLQCVAVCCSVLQCVAACCSVLQCVAMSVAGRSVAASSCVPSRHATYSTLSNMWYHVTLYSAKETYSAIETYHLKISRLLKIPIGLFCKRAL